MNYVIYLQLIGLNYDKYLQFVGLNSDNYLQFIGLNSDTYHVIQHVFGSCGWFGHQDTYYINVLTGCVQCVFDAMWFLRV